MKMPQEKPRPKRRGAQPARKRVAAPAAAAPEIPSVQPSASKVRGEHELVLAGTTFRLRPTREAIMAIEAKVEPLIPLVTRGNAGAISLAHLSIIAAELIHAGADDDVTRMISAERIAELIYEQGVGRPLARLVTCLLDAANGGRTIAGNAKAAAG